MPWCYQRGFSQWFFFGIAVGISSTAKVLSSKNISFLKHATQFLLNNMVTLLMGTRYFRKWHQACVNALPTRTTVFYQSAVWVRGKQFLLYAHGTCFSTDTLLQQGLCETNKCMPLNKYGPLGSSRSYTLSCLTVTLLKKKDHWTVQRPT